MKLQHGGIAVDLPEDWSDRSSLLFVAPADDGPVTTTNSVQRPTEAVAVNFILTSETDPAALLCEQETSLAAVGSAPELLGEGPFRCGLGEGWRRTLRLEIDETAVCQINVACIRGGIAVVATASAAAIRFPRVENQLNSILESLGVS